MSSPNFLQSLVETLRQEIPSFFFPLGSTCMHVSKELRLSQLWFNQRLMASLACKSGLTFFFFCYQEMIHLSQFFLLALWSSCILIKKIIGFCRSHTDIVCLRTSAISFQILLILVAGPYVSHLQGAGGDGDANVQRQKKNVFTFSSFG